MKTIYAIGGGDLQNLETLKLDEFLASKAKEHANGNRPYALFIPTGSHDFFPYYNTFHRIYCGQFGVKTDVILSVDHELNLEKTKNRFLKADLIYIGGGNTIFMMGTWKNSGLLPFILDAYNRGVIICGLSAGAICYFEKIYTDSFTDKYDFTEGLCWIKGNACPHYNLRRDELLSILDKDEEFIGIENNAMLEILDGEITQCISNGGHAYFVKNKVEKLIPEITIK